MTPIAFMNLTAILTQLRMSDIAWVFAVEENITEVLIFQARSFQRLFDFRFGKPYS